MPEIKHVHPVRRVRESLKSLSEPSGLREHSTIKGFARWLGRSESSIRNVENDIAPLSKGLAKRIQEQTGVSAEWLLSSPGPDDPILDTSGQEWNAGERLDWYAGGKSQLNLNLLLNLVPNQVPAMLAQMVEFQLRADLANGSTAFLQSVMKLLGDSKLFSSPRYLENMKTIFVNDLKDAKLQIWEVKNGDGRGAQAQIDSYSAILSKISGEGMPKF